MTTLIKRSISGILIVAIVSGAIIVGQDPKKQELLYDIGLNIGLLFHFS